ncbi:hypothetical protein APASM_4379 [Actinosynnema pretiosum subsp. pretiosum]|nr:hypothetical protein APASM_4379 [Actinosynnema pretiosum subsp. pretiosum]
MDDVRHAEVPVHRLSPVGNRKAVPEHLYPIGDWCGRGRSGFPRAPSQEVLSSAKGDRWVHRPETPGCGRVIIHVLCRGVRVGLSGYSRPFGCVH